MLLHRGVWGSRRIFSKGPLYANYGYLWWLNTRRALYPSASAQSYCARYFSSNMAD